MEERYPYIRFVIDAAHVIAAGVAAIVLLGGLVSSCSQGGFGGFLSFLITLAVACAAYIVVMVKIEALRVFLDIESATRTLEQRRPAEPASGRTASPVAPAPPTGAS